MENALESLFTQQLRQRRTRLVAATHCAPDSRQLKQLLRQVDAALEKVESRTFGLCETCKEPIEPERLLADPLVRNCLDHLSMQEQRVLEFDLDLAYRTQAALLPRPDLEISGWSSSYHYEPAGPVSGDYCDLILNSEEDAFYFMTGDVAGKGVAASLLMAHLHAIFRTLTSIGQPVFKLMQQANRIFCEGTLSSHYATLVFGKASRHGDVELCNAGHCPPLLARGEQVEPIASGSLPLGMFCSGHFETSQVLVEPGECLVLYTDGLSESLNPMGEQYGTDRLAQVIREKSSSCPGDMIRSCLRDLNTFRAGAPIADDLTLLVLKKE